MNPSAGDPIPPWTVERVSPDKMKTVAAILRDPNPIHWDPRVLGDRNLGERVIAQGPLCLGYIVNMLMSWAGPESIRRLKTRFSGPVYGDDCVTAKGRVTGLREEGDRRLAECEVWLEHDDGARALEGEALVILPR